MDNNSFNTRKRERGQTIILVAVALLALLSMAALAIDIVTLYVARSEAQRAANAAAIAGAKMFTTSGVTSVQGGGGPAPVTLGDACTAATAQAQAVALQNTIAGQAATATATCNTATPANPQITVSVAQSGLPTFFARIWNRSSTSVSATATAEAYNPSGNEPPIQVSVKPWFIPNCDVSNTTPPNPNCGGYAPFVNTAIAPNDGSIANNGSFIGETITLTKVPNASGLTLCVGGCTPPCPPGACNTQYYPLNIPETTAPVCPSSSTTTSTSCANVGGGDDYFDNIACASQNQISCGQLLGRGETIDVDNNNNDSVEVPSTEATQCLIHGNTVGAIDGQDTLNVVATGKPTAFTGGNNNPNSSFQRVPNISRSDSVVTVPLYDGVGGGTPLNLCRPGRFCNQRAAVVGFLQLAIIQANANGVFQARILNVAGCHRAPTGNTVSGGGVSPVPVRLITPP